MFTKLTTRFSFPLNFMVNFKLMCTIHEFCDLDLCSLVDFTIDKRIEQIEQIPRHHLR